MNALSNGGQKKRRSVAFRQPETGWNNIRLIFIQIYGRYATISLASTVRLQTGRRLEILEKQDFGIVFFSLTIFNALNHVLVQTQWFIRRIIYEIESWQLEASTIVNNLNGTMHCHFFPSLLGSFYFNSEKFRAIRITAFRMKILVRDLGNLSHDIHFLMPSLLSLSVGRSSCESVFLCKRMQPAKWQKRVPKPDPIFGISAPASPLGFFKVIWWRRHEMKANEPVGKPNAPNCEEGPVG